MIQNWNRDFEYLTVMGMEDYCRVDEGNPTLKVETGLSVAAAVSNFPMNSSLLLKCFYSMYSLGVGPNYSLLL